MKPSAEDWESQELDKLLFDYLEGNLLEEKARELEQKAASDVFLGSEIEYWKDTMVTSDFYDTSLLEEKLLMAENIPASQAVKTGTSASLYLFVWMVCLCSLWPAQLEKAALLMDDKNAFRITATETISKVLPGPELIGVEKSITPDITSHQQMLPVAVIPSVDRLSKSAVTAFKRLDSRPLTLYKEVNEVFLPEVATKKLTLKKMPAPRTISRKQARHIARMKERALQRRKANEFLKGRIPYVVPLNTRNF